MIVSTLHQVQGRGSVVFRDIDMKHATQTQFGRPVEAVLTSQITTDKWQALGALTDAAERFELSHRTLGVLKALMTFLPGRFISPVAGEAIVFPSNRTLSHRLNGMPDSTLRRHLAQLVRVGIVSRHDSPNRKRYARRVGQGIGIAFGFDLSPLARQNDMLCKVASEAREEHERLQALRSRALQLRHELLAKAGQGVVTNDAQNILRRKPEAGVLTELVGRIQTELDALDTPEMGASDDQIERHIQYETKYISDSEAPITDPELQKNADRHLENDAMSQRNKTPDLKTVLAVCQEFQTYYPAHIRHWNDLVSVSERLTAMIGIDPPVFKQAIAAMGASRAATVVLCILENIQSISNPGGYLRRLTQQAQDGHFSEKPMLAAIANRLELSADNHDKCFISAC